MDYRSNLTIIHVVITGVTENLISWNFHDIFDLLFNIHMIEYINFVISNCKLFVKIFGFHMIKNCVSAILNSKFQNILLFILSICIRIHVYVQMKYLW